MRLPGAPFVSPTPGRPRVRRKRRLSYLPADSGSVVRGPDHGQLVSRGTNRKTVSDHTSVRTLWDFYFPGPMFGDVWKSRRR